MIYRITGAPRTGAAKYFSRTAEELAATGARGMIADADRGYPCRVSLDDAATGESVLLINYASHDVAGPYRSAYAICVRDGAGEGGPFVDRRQPVFAGHTLKVRGFDSEGTAHAALLASPAEQEDAIETLSHMPPVACIDASNPAYGCFSAWGRRYGGER